MPATVRFGTNPIAWSNDDDRTLGAGISLQRCLDDAAAIGFDGIEKGHKMPDAPGPLAAALAPYRLSLVSAWHSMGLLGHGVEAERRAIDPHLDLLCELGCDVCIVCETTGAVHADPDVPLSARPTLSRDEWTRFPRAVDEIAGHCSRRGVSLVYHHHMGTVVQRRSEVDRLLAATGAATQLLLDTGHACFGGMDPTSVAADHGERIAHLHCKNVRGDVLARALDQDLSFLDAVRAGVFTVPGDPEGMVDLAGVLIHLSRAGYRGWLVVEAEQDPALREPREYQEMGLRALRALARDAGFDWSPEG